MDIKQYTAELMEAIGPVIREAITAQIAPIVARVDAVEARQKEWRHTGPWQQDQRYKVGNHCTQNGHTWHCERDNYGCKPGDSDNWRLVVRAGRDLR